MSAKSTWLSAHLYYNEPRETFLTEAVAKYIETVLKTGIADSYFFIRYWEHGPHIRLRFLGKADVLEQVLKPNLLEYFHAYMQTNPSSRTEPDYPEGFPKSHQWYPDNSIRFETYQAETERYGGPKGLQLSEQQFHLSTTTVLHYLRQQAHQNDYAERLGDAIRLHLAFVHSIGLDQAMAVHFFNMIFENWLPHTIELPETMQQKDYLIEKMNETVDLFKLAFEEQQEGLVAFHQQLMSDLKSGGAFESDVYNNWIKKNRLLSLQLAKLADQGQIPKRRDAYSMSKEIEKRLSPTQQSLWNIWADYIHMTNNRLGIFNKDEAYLAFLIRKSLEALL